MTAANSISERQGAAVTPASEKRRMNIEEHIPAQALQNRRMDTRRYARLREKCQGIRAWFEKGSIYLHKKLSVTMRNFFLKL